MEIKVKFKKEDVQENLRKTFRSIKTTFKSSSTQEAETLFPFIGGAVGYAGYDINSAI